MTQTFKYLDPSGKPILIDAEDQDAADVQLLAQVAKLQNMPVVPKFTPDPAKGMDTTDKILTGALGGMRKVRTGVRKLVGTTSPADLEEEALMDKYGPNLGPAGAIASGAGEALATAPVGGPVGAAAKFLTKSAPIAKTIANVGFGRVANAGTMARGGAEGALADALIGDIDDKDLKDRLDNVVRGAKWGVAAPAALGTVMQGPKALVKAADKFAEGVSPFRGSVEKRAYKAFENTLKGREGVTDAVRKAVEANPSVLPKSTAALTGEPRLAALEKGARERANVDWPSHDESVGRAAWDELSNVYGEGGDILRETFNRGGIPQTKKVVGMYGNKENRIPMLEAGPLRRATGKTANALNTEGRATADELANELGQYEFAKSGAGSTIPQYHGDYNLIPAAMAIASAGTNSPLLWKLRSAYNTITGSSVVKSNKLIDEALLDPNKFVKLMQDIQAKTDKGRPLSFAERALKESLLSTSRQTESSDAIGVR